MKLSAVCITYGRPALLEEAIESFLRQDYQGPKELIILNDCVGQQLEFHHPQVIVSNSTVRFKSIGEKRNACAALSTGDFLLPWDDDDIHLPNRMSISALHAAKKPFFNPRMTATFINGRILKPDRNGFPSIACYSRDLFNSVQGYAHINSGQDSELEKRFSAKTSIATTVIDEGDIYYLYRWYGTGSYHLSAYGVDSVTGKNGMAICHDFLANKDLMPSGKIVLRPHWKQDYVALVHGQKNQASLE